MQKSHVKNSGNGIEITGGRSQSLVMLEDNLFKLSLDAKRGVKHVAVKAINKDKVWLLSHKNKNSACRLGSISYNTFLSGGFAEGSTIVPNSFNTKLGVDRCP